MQKIADNVNGRKRSEREATGMLDKTRKDWAAEAESLNIESRAFIFGRYQDALSG
jgi:hypothetical protein